MRTSLVLSLIAAAAATASAEPARTVCYAGSQTAKVGTMEQTARAVLERTYDPARNEIRQRTWSDKNPTKEVAMTGKVDPKTNTFEFEDPQFGAKGTGKLEGKPWHWSAFTMTLTKGDFVVTSTSSVSDTKIHQVGTMKNKGQLVGNVTGDLTAFDCKQLDAKKAALATSAPAAPAPAPKAPDMKAPDTKAPGTKAPETKPAPKPAPSK